MFNPLTIPFGARMLFNVVRLKPGYCIFRPNLNTHSGSI